MYPQRYSALDRCNGTLRVQVRPGSWQIGITARGAAVSNEITMPAAQQNLPETEIWSYSSNDNLRVTAAEGLPPVDPLQVEVPPGWTELPAFRASAGDSLSIIERSRGIVSAENDLSLSRTMWLAFDRSSFVVNDSITGTMRTDWRLDMSPPFSLLNASANLDNLLVTDGAGEGQTHRAAFSQSRRRNQCHGERKRLTAGNILGHAI